MLFMYNLPQLLCLVVVILLTLPRKPAIALSIVVMLFVYSPLAGKVILLSLLGLAIYKGFSIYRKQSSIPSMTYMVASAGATVVLMVMLLMLGSFFVRNGIDPFWLIGSNPLLISLILVMVIPKAVVYFRAHPIDLSFVMNKRMLASLLVFAITFQWIDIASQGSPFAEEDSSVLLFWLLSISGMLAYGLALNRIPALIISAVFYVMGVVYLTELFALRPYLAELRRFSDVFDVFSPWLLTVFVIHMVSLICVLVYTWGYKPNPLPAAQMLDRFSGLGAKVQQHTATGMEGAKAFAQTHQLDSKLEQASEQVKQHLAEADYAGQFQQQLNRLKSAHQQDPNGVKVKAAIVVGAALLLIWLVIF
uniref:hypothetical protein n=1 Tax=Rheinheimera sp. TaxID=1869214 RepID=UPI0040472D48